MCVVSYYRSRDCLIVHLANPDPMADEVYVRTNFMINLSFSNKKSKVVEKNRKFQSNGLQNKKKSEAFKCQYA